MRRLIYIPLTVAVVAIILGMAQTVEAEEIFLVHLKTGLKKDDAQICVAYNVIWAAIEEGYKVKVLIDADAINTYKVGWSDKDNIEGYKIPENLRMALADQFKVRIDTVPKSYGEYLVLLKNKGAEFYINSGFLIVSKIGKPDNLLDKVSAKFFKPITLKEMVRMRADAGYYMVY